GKKQFIAGAEESYGYLIGEHARDKDAIVSAAIIAEMAAFYKDQGSSLYETLLDIYLEYGYFKEKLVSVYKKGKKGAEEIQSMMKNYRQSPPAKLGGSKVVTIKDFKTQEEKNIESGETSTIALPASNVLQFITDDGSRVTVRPSGTEPKIKFYCSVNTEIQNRNDFDEATEELESRMDDLIKDLNA
ncbi:MAG TPA: phospho-sugar mutase, partial [Balneolaceae bacterium]|nr:phospho-sugar mutase [Balneolaceae bacterium]